MTMTSSKALLCILWLISIVNSFNIREHLGTRSPYEGEGGSDTPPPEGCSPHPVYFNLVARHGTREPVQTEYNELSKLQEVLAKYSSCIENPDFAWMQV